MGCEFVRGSVWIWGWKMLFVEVAPFFFLGSPEHEAGQALIRQPNASSQHREGACQPRDSLVKGFRSEQPSRMAVEPADASPRAGELSPNNLALGDASVLSSLQNKGCFWLCCWPREAQAGWSLQRAGQEPWICTQLPGIEQMAWAGRASVSPAVS